LKQQLREAQDLISRLREENNELKSQIDSSPTKRQALINKQAEATKDKNSDSTFITRGAENPNILCDNW